MEQSTSSEYIITGQIVSEETIDSLYIYNTIFDYNIVVIMGKAITLLKKYCPSGYFCLLENEAFLYDLIHKELSASCLVINRESLESRSDGTWYWKSDSNQLG